MKRIVLAALITVVGLVGQTVPITQTVFTARTTAGTFTVPAVGQQSHALTVVFTSASAITGFVLRLEGSFDGGTTWLAVSADLSSATSNGSTAAATVRANGVYPRLRVNYATALSGSPASAYYVGTAAPVLDGFSFGGGNGGGTGPQGPAGPAGAAGAAGAAGYSPVPRVGSGVPASGLGSNGDIYLNSANGDFYTKAAGAWTTSANLKGPAGSGGGGTAPYITSLFTAQTSVTVLGSAHGFATPALTTVATDNATPRCVIGSLDSAPGCTTATKVKSISINATTFDVLYTFDGPTTGYLIVNGGVGPAGANGTNGTNGTNGAAGYSPVPRVGSGVPASGLGSNGDIYLNSANGDFYTKAAGAWTTSANLKGASGSSSLTLTELRDLSVCSFVSGSIANVEVCALNTSALSFNVGDTIRWRPNFTNTSTTPTLDATNNIDGPRLITKNGGNTLAVGDYKAGNAIFATFISGNRWDITVDAPPGYQTVQNSGTSLPSQPTMNMSGAGVTCSNNAGSSRTDCVIPGVSASGWTITNTFPTGTDSLSCSTVGAGVDQAFATAPPAITANSLTLGKMVRTTYLLEITSTAAPAQMLLKGKYGSTAYYAGITGSTPTASMTAHGGSIILLLTGTGAASSTANVEAAHAGATPVTPLQSRNTIAQPTVLDTTVPGALSLVLNCPTTTAGNSVRLRQIITETN